ncbi:RNA polymerase recycling motor HelD [Halobacillus karajensis]|uniref:Helicase IV n=1 Tax=Halobacillus karajensis TaxID=195088 RepID=A0A024P7B7_9BACI|nr:RNA polymerase recycling motor HelD [Halobacillus karajensis]CDQ21181.1 Helicase IV [Halobacillus karajensis]CDQ24755.1 Helicase IV [Halobacillus karajensis]CDQ28885.1 Helicase IV [Halobacillus karajensis]
MTERHPDFEQELDRLSFTKAYMDHLITSQESDQEDLKNRQEDTLENLTFKDSSLRYQEMLSHANFMKMSNDQLESLKHLRNKPYFARIDFHQKEKPERETFYIGKTSLFDRETQLPIILDWRSPLANVYYEGRLGEVSYEALGERYEGEVSLKRQYQIEEGELCDYRDIDLTTKDELLQDSLAQNSENRITEIVSTIQEEQNQIIRADLRKPIIVQGAAGSGKTTIALHRISYFLYTMKDIFHPEEMLILAPNRLFIHYISEVLPELGVDKARQTTYMDFVQTATGIDLPVISQHEVLMKSVEGSMPASQLSYAGFKGSKSFKRILDRYLQRLKKSYKVDEDFTLCGFRIKSAKGINRLFFEEYSYFPYEVRVQKIKAVLQSELRRKKKQILTKMATKYDEALDQALYGMKDANKRKIRVSFLITRKEERLKEIKQAARTAVSKYMKQFPKVNVLSFYQKLFDETAFMSLCPEASYDVQMIRKETKKAHENKKLYAEDLAPLLYLQTFITGMDPDYRAKKVVIDEAQDYSFMEIYSLRKAFQTDLFTIVGDLAQGIYHYRGIGNWEMLQQEIFPTAQYLTLQKTYRTTIEIMNLANGLLDRMPEELPKAEPVVRHGELPVFIERSVNWKRRLREQIDELQNSGMKSFAVVTKSKQEANLVAEQLKAAGLHFETMKEDQNELGNQVILPAYLAKGLEFDVVFLYCEHQPYEENERDIKMLYVAMTRALHRLYMIGQKPEDFLLSKTENNLYCKV